jgi:ABC-2 type transport system permease protein
VTGLIRSEARRLLSRRLFRVLALLALLGIVIGVAIVGTRSHRPSADDEAALRVQIRQEIEQCIEQKYFSLQPGETMEQVCTDAFSDQTPPDEYALTGLTDTLRGTSFILLVLGLVIGASAVGADWQTGSMATLLVWEPRRIRVLTVRAIVVGIAVFLLALALQGVLAGLLTLVANTRGSTAGTGGDFTRTLLGVMGRIAVMTAILALIAVAISTIGRTTAASLGVVFVYLALVESLLHVLIPRITPWLLSVNTAVFVDGRAQDVGDNPPVHLTPGHSTVIVVAYAVVLLVAAGAFFRTRDVS